MDEETLRVRLWQGFARLQALLGGHAKGGGVVRDAGLVASVVPHSPDSPALNAVVALDPDSTVARLDELERTYRGAGVRRWGLWLDGSARAAAAVLRERGMAGASSSPGMGAPIEALDLDG